MRYELDIQLVIADIDGTFLDSNGNPSKGAFDAITGVRQQGIKFTLCSGRGDPMVAPLVKYLHLTLPYIASGGSTILSATGPEVIWQKELSEEKIARAVQFGAENQCEILFHTAREIYVVVSDIFWNRLIGWEWMKGHIISPFVRVDQWHHLPSQDIIRLDFFPSNGCVPELAKKIALLGNDFCVMVMKHNIEITDSHINKGSALVRLAEYLKIPLENIMALGDGMNDMSMLDKAGLGIALKNATEIVQSSANFVAPSNDDGGLAWALHNYLKDGQTSHGVILAE